MISLSKDIGFVNLASGEFRTTKSPTKLIEYWLKSALFRRIASAIIIRERRRHFLGASLSPIRGRY